MKTEGGKPNEWSKEYPVTENSVDASIPEGCDFGDRATRLNFKDIVGSMAKQFRYNRATYSGPLEPDILPNEEMLQLEKYERKAQSINLQDDSDGKR